jgi:hypothetical protein
MLLFELKRVNIRAQEISQFSGVLAGSRRERRQSGADPPSGIRLDIGTIKSVLMPQRSRMDERPEMRHPLK